MRFFNLSNTTLPELFTELKYRIGMPLGEERLKLLPDMRVVGKIAFFFPGVVPGILGCQTTNFLAQGADKLINLPALKPRRIMKSTGDFRKIESHFNQ